MKEIFGTLAAMLLLASLAAFVITCVHWASSTFDQRSLEACVKACGARGISSSVGSSCSCRDPR